MLPLSRNKASVYSNRRPPQETLNTTMRPTGHVDPAPQKHLHHSSWNYDSEKLWKKGAESQNNKKSAVKHSLLEMAT